MRETTFGGTAAQLDPTGVLGRGDGGVGFGVPDAKGIRDHDDTGGY
jgi:hypothetical protein